MNRTLKAQLKKVYGKDFNIDSQGEKFKQFLDLLEVGYEDSTAEKKLLERTLEVSSQELGELNQEIHQNHKLIKSVTNSITDIIFYKDLNLNYIGCNKKFEEILGISESKVIGKNDFDFFDNDIALRHRQMDKEVIESGEKVVNSWWLNFRNGESRYMLSTKAPLFDTLGKIDGIVGVSRDITDEYRIKQDLESKKLELIQQSRLASMGDMIGNIAHQWRQPLNSLALVIQKIGFYHERGILQEKDIKKDIEKSMMLVNGMSDTINDFRDFFNPGRIKNDFNISCAVRAAFSIIEPILKDKYIEYSYQESGEHIINGFKNEFSQVVLNILNNAKDALIDANVKNPKISVKISQLGSKILISIEDNAGGISEDLVERIFEPYFTTKEEGKGTGIGLYMSKMIIEDHMNGSLSAKNFHDGMLFGIII